jgi:mRNA interferase RelE/StbE
MPAYAVTFARSARKELVGLNQPLQLRVFRRIERLADDPRPAGCRKLEGADDLWRIRIGDCRVVYAVDDSRHLVDVIAVRHRSDAYR